MQVAICDDDATFRNQIIGFLIQYKKLHLLCIDIFQFKSGNELLSSNDIFDLVFLDYQMPGLDGLNTARMLRERNSLCNIVFVTNFPDFVFDSFEVSPYRFLPKPISDFQITNLMNNFIAKQKQLSPIIVINNKERFIIESKEVIHLEADGKYCKIKTNHDVYISSKTLSQVHKLLPQHCFYRVHRSFVVNLFCIKSYNDMFITLLNNEKIDIARNKRAEFKRIYSAFINDYYLRT